MSDSASFGLWLKQRRRALDLTQDALAEGVGCSTATIEKIESGKRRPSRQIVELLAEHLRIPVGDRPAFMQLARGEPDRPISSLPTATIPALRHAPQPRHRRPNNLPAPLTQLIGREKEVEAVRNRILNDGVRLLTLTGPPGIGKTRLSLQVAEELLDEFESGVYFVELAPIKDPGLVPPTIAHTLGVREGGNKSLKDSLKEYLRDRQMLLVLDNFEHVAEAGPLVSELLKAARQLMVLVSSRVKLHIYGEHDFPVPPMTLPPFASERSNVPTFQRSNAAEDLTQYEAIRLFMARASAIKPDFSITGENAQVVSEICHRLDGLPLAIELAAACIRMLSPQAMLERLESRLKLLAGGAADLPERQQTLRAAINWSYDLLSEPERTVFGQLSVFAGDWTLEAAEAVCVGTLEHSNEDDVLTLLMQLMDKSLVVAEEQGGQFRYRMLETISEYARTKLTDMLAYDHMVEYFAGYVENNPTDYAGLALETPNMLVVLQAAFDRGLWAALVRGANAFYHFLETRGLYELAETHLRRAEQAARSVDDTLGLVTTLLNLGRVTEQRGNYAQAEAYYQEGLVLARSMEHRERISALLQNLGGVIIRRGDYAQAEAYLLEGLALAREIGDAEHISALLGNLGTVAANRGDYDQSEAYYRESLDLARAIGNRERICALLIGLGATEGNRGDYAQAEVYFKEGLTLARDIGHRERISFLLLTLGLVANNRGDYSEAEAYFQEGLALAREIENRERISNLLEKLGELSCNRGDYQQAEAYLLEGLDLARALNHRERISGVLCTLGVVASREEDYAQAEIYFSESLDLARDIGHQLRIANILDEWGELYLKRDQADSASTAFNEALTIAREVGSQNLIATTLFGLARTALAQNDPTTACLRGRESLWIFESIGHKKVEEVKHWLTDRELYQVNY